MTLAFNFAARSDVGLVRTTNQDSGYAGPHLLAVADGMGGHAGGDLASATAIAEIFDLDDEAYLGHELSSLLAQRLLAANAELARLVADDKRLRGMGTTATAILRARDTIALAHIGDSRAYLLRGGELTQLTKDHSFVQTLIDEGRITPDEAATHPQRSLVTRVLTGSEVDEPDIVVRKLQLGDRYLLCSDGLSGFVAQDTIADVLAGHASAAETAERLVDLTLRAGAPDNVTVIIADVVDVTVTRTSTGSQIVGAAAAHRKGTRPLPLTPAAKAAALAAQATGSGETDSLQLAEEGPTSRIGRTMRWLAAVAAFAVVAAGGLYAAYQWTQRQYFVGDYQGKIAIYQGISTSLGPLSLSQARNITDVETADLPDYYRQEVEATVAYSDLPTAIGVVNALRIKAADCRNSRDAGRECIAGPDPDLILPGQPTTAPATTTSPITTPSSSLTSEDTATTTPIPGPSPTPSASIASDGGAT